MVELQKILDALSSPVRREILWLVRDTELAAGSISTAFELTAPTISEHLAVLRDAELITVRRSGTFRYYRARHDVLSCLQTLLRDEGAKWTPADNLPERAGAAAATGQLVTVYTTVPVDRPTAFRGFTEAGLFSRWLGVPFSLDASGNFACTLEWGTSVRGRYTEICPPSLIAMRWDFADDDIPVPGGERDAYLRFSETEDGCHVRVHQLVADEQQARFMETAWSTLLGRLHHGLADAAGPAPTAPARLPRPKSLLRQPMRQP